jgi:4-deoxy-L-threo-5-hexosulose-uronate ketol-isomerase
MHVNIRQATHPDMVASLDTDSLRSHYVVTDFFADGDFRLTYSHNERLIVGGAMPVREPMQLSSPKELGTEQFLARREMGVINIGGAGGITVDGRAHSMKPRDGIYIPMGTKDVVFESADPSNPARFYLVSCPAHARFETVKISIDSANPLRLGAPETSNKRTIYQYINPDICKSSQLLLGLTALEPGSVWNTMPCHLHDRRSEVYFYFDLKQNERVFHFMGRPDRTRHLVLSNEQAVISPPWSIHTGCGTSNYAFIWAMAGENQDYKDMAVVPTTELR